LQDVENTGTSFSRALAANTLAATTASQPDAANTAEHAGSADPAPLAEEDNDPADGSDAAVAMSMEELNYLQVEMVRERDRDVVQDVVNALLDRLEDQEPKIQSEILMILSDLIPSLVLQRRLELAASTLRSLRQLSTQDGFADATLQAELQQTLESVGNSAAIVGVLQALEAGDLVTEDAVVAEFLSCIGASSIETTLRIRERTSRNSLRVTLDTAMNEALQRHPERVAELCRSQDATVACAAIQLLGQSAREPVETHLLPLLQHRNPKVRIALIEVMVLHGGSKLLQPMVAALQDDNREVRCAAAWGLGTWRFPQALVALEAIVESKEIRDATSNEMRAMFSAYARVGQQKSLATLGSILNKKSLFGKREPTEMRVCAARALGALKSPEAEKQLQQAANDKDTSVRRAVTRSLLAGGK
jgi:HEAT repeat protein